MFVVKGVAKHQRPNYLIWEESKGPDVVIELTSRTTREEDIEDKYELYQDTLRVPEYFLFDPLGEYLRSSLEGYRLRRGRYEAITPVKGRLPSKVLGLHLEGHGRDLRLYDPTAKQWLPTADERFRRPRRWLWKKPRAGSGRRRKSSACAANWRACAAVPTVNDVLRRDTGEPMTQPLFDRRRFLWQSGGGLGGVALAYLLGRDGLLAADAPTFGKGRPELNGGLHHKAKAKRVVQMFMSGAASQVDTFDYKPELIKRHGQPFDPGGKVELFQSAPGACMKAPWDWKQYGQCGKWVSGLLPNLAECVDDMAFLHAMVSKSNVHGPATFMQTTGFVLPGFPSMGAWVSYGLGSLSDDLPAFVVLPDARGFAPNGPANWGSAFLPAAYQGTMIRPGSKNPIYDLFPPEDAGVGKDDDADALALLNRMNKAHQATREGDSRLDARIASYEMAAKLQLTRAGGAGPVEGAGVGQADVRPGREDHRGFRPQLSHRPAAARARRALRAALERGRQRLPAPQLGLARRHRPRPRRHGREHGQAGRGAAEGPEGARPARRHDRPVDDGVRPDAVQPGRQGPRPQPVHVHVLGGRRRLQGRRQLRRQRRMVVQGGRGRDLLLRPARHDPAPARRRPQAADVPPQRHRPPADGRAWECDRQASGVSNRPGRSAAARYNAGVMEHHCDDLQEHLTHPAAAEAALAALRRRRRNGSGSASAPRPRSSDWRGPRSRPAVICLLSAPTGAGKTLAAFLPILGRLLDPAELLAGAVRPLPLCRTRSRR